MIIFRVVDSKGDGMYRVENNSPLWNECCEGYDDDYHHPAPCQLFRRISSKDKDLSDYFFGFATVSQLHHWIFKDKWRKNIDKAGGRVLVFETTDLVGDRHQVAFNKHSAKLIDDVSILELENGSYIPKV